MTTKKQTAKELPSQEELNSSFRYCEKTGDLYFKKDFGKRKAGQKATRIAYIEKSNRYSYKTIFYKNQKYAQSRLVFCMFHGGSFEKIFFQDEDRTNTRIENLTNLNVSYLRGRKKSYKTQKGVAFQNNRYRARITINKEQIYLGSFKTEEEAANAYQEAAKQRSQYFKF